MGHGMDSVVCRIKLPQRVPYGCVGHLSSPSCTHASIYSLHGTWLPPSLTRRQRDPSPLPDQPLLQDKIARSRLLHAASILFSRPTHREKSAFETTYLALLWPASIGVLALAVLEGISHWRRDEAVVASDLDWSHSNITALNVLDSESLYRSLPWSLVCSESSYRLSQVTKSSQSVSVLLVVFVILFRSTLKSKRHLTAAR